MNLLGNKKYDCRRLKSQKIMLGWSNYYLSLMVDKSESTVCDTLNMRSTTMHQDNFYRYAKYLGVKYEDSSRGSK